MNNHISTIIITPLLALSSYNFPCSNCFLCKNYLNKLLTPASFTDSVAQVFSNEAELPLVIGQMILTRINGTWETGLYMGEAEQVHQVHTCENHQTLYLPDSNLRLLKFMYQLNWQPHLPVAITINTIAQYMHTLARTTKDPYLLGKIIKNRGKIIVIGDLHGSSKSLRHILMNLASKGIIDSNGKLAKNHICVFTGDYTDRHYRGPEVWQILSYLKLKNPQQVFLLRGNHETLDMAVQYKFFHEWSNSCTSPGTRDKKDLLQDLFNSLAAGMVIGTKTESTTEKPYGTYHFILFAHGGLDPLAPLMKIINKTITAHQALGKSVVVSQSYTHPNFEFSGLLWGDFFANETDCQEPKALPSNRGPLMTTCNTSAAYEFMESLCSNHPRHTFTLDAMVRGHQHNPGGISVLRRKKCYDQDFKPLTHQVCQVIKHPTVYTCISSPEGLAPYGCFEDSYAIIERTEDDHWKLTPYIFRRVPKKFAHLTE